MEVWSVRSKVTNPTKARVGRRTRPNPKKAAPKLLAVATRPRATRPPETAARNMFARPVDSAIVAARAPWSTKCPVVTNVTAAERGSASSLLRTSLSVAGFIGRPCLFDDLPGDLLELVVDLRAGVPRDPGAADRHDARLDQARAVTPLED